MDSFAQLQELSVKVLFCSDLECVKTRLLTVSGIYLIMAGIQTFKVTAAPYGKFSQTDLKPKYQLSARLGWCLQEVPAFLMSFLAILHAMDRGEKNLVFLLVPFTVHYFNRSFIFPFTIKEGTGLTGHRNKGERFSVNRYFP